mgnify:CR=1 FL=1
MELTMNTRREIMKKMAPEYQKATKKKKKDLRPTPPSQPTLFPAWSRYSLLPTGYQTGFPRASES